MYALRSNKHFKLLLIIFLALIIFIVFSLHSFTYSRLLFYSNSNSKEQQQQQKEEEEEKEGKDEVFEDLFSSDRQRSLLKTASQRVSDSLKKCQQNSQRIFKNKQQQNRITSVNEIPAWTRKGKNKKPRFAVLTVIISPPNIDFLDKTRINRVHQLGFYNKLQYCLKNNYDFIVEDDMILHDESLFRNNNNNNINNNYNNNNLFLSLEKTLFEKGKRSIAWAKILAIRKWIKGYDFIFWIDADAFFVDMINFRLEDLVYSSSNHLKKKKKKKKEMKRKNEEEKITSTNDDDDDEDFDIVISKDFSDINSGIALYKNTPWTKRFLFRIWNLPKDVLQNTKYPGEQGALIFLMKNDKKKHVAQHFLITNDDQQEQEEAEDNDNNVVPPLENENENNDKNKINPPHFFTLNAYPREFIPNLQEEQHGKNSSSRKKQYQFIEGVDPICHLVQCGIQEICVNAAERIFRLAVCLNRNNIKKEDDELELDKFLMLMKEAPTREVGFPRFYYPPS